MIDAFFLSRIKARRIGAVPMPAIGTDHGVHLTELLMMTGLIAVRNEPRLSGPIILRRFGGKRQF